MLDKLPLKANEQNPKPKKKKEAEGNMYLCSLFQFPITVELLKLAANQYDALGSFVNI